MAGKIIQGNFGGKGSGAGNQPSTASLVRYAIWEIRHDKKKHRTVDAVARALFNRIWSQELQEENGNFIVSLPDRRCFLLTGTSHQLYEISPRDEDFTAYLWFKYGLLKTENITKHVIAAMAAYCRMRGVMREVRRFVCYDRYKEILYISRYDGTAWQIDGSGYVEVVPNGTGPALFIDDDQGATVKDPVIADNRLLIPRLIDGINYVDTTSGGMTPTQQRLALAIWIFTIAFPDLMPSKPILLVEGEKGSGKCLGKGTPVLMYDGTTKPVEEIRNGDLVMGPDSKPRKVGGVTSGRGPLYRIVPTEGMSWVCNEDHILTLALSEKIKAHDKHDKSLDHQCIADVPLTDCSPHKDGTQVRGRGHAMLIRIGPDKVYTSFRIEPIGNGLYYGFTLDGDGRFLLSDFTVTHNTSAMQLMQRALHGAKRKTHMVAKDDERDFPIKLLRSPICIIDNVDSFVDWLQNGIAMYVTDGGWSRRKLYTDDAEVELLPQSFIAITSRNPLTFKRDDVADRCIIFRLQRRETNRPLSRLQREIDDERPEIFGEWLFLLDRIVAEIRAGTLESKTNTTSHRMADFAALAHVIGKVMGVGEDEVEEMLDGMQAERDALIAEGDPVIEFLDRWLENTKNVGRPITSNDLFKELSEIAKQNNRSFYKSPATLAQKLRSQAVEKLYEVRDGGVKGNAKLYEIRRQSRK